MGLSIVANGPGWRMRQESSLSHRLQIDGVDRELLVCKSISTWYCYQVPRAMHPITAGSPQELADAVLRQIKFSPSDLAAANVANPADNTEASPRK